MNMSMQVIQPRGGGRVCVCVCVMAGGWDRRAGLRRHDQHQYSGVAFTLVVHGPKNRSVVHDTRRRQPKRQAVDMSCVLTQTLLDLSNTNTHTKTLASDLGQRDPQFLKSWLLKITKKYYICFPFIWDSPVQLRNGKNQVSASFLFSFDIQLLQNFVIPIKALT